MAKQNKSRKLFATTATAALVASAIVPVASAADVNDFNQVPSWAKDAVQYLIDNGSVQGDQNGNFNPTKNLTRAQAAEILTKELGLEATGTENFTDVSESNWFYNAVLATSPEIFNGNEKGEFKPNANLTRQEAAKVLVEAYGLTGSASLAGFPDASKVPGWSKSYLETAVANGVINGKGALLAPTDNISNAEFATMVKRAIDASSKVAGVSVTAINNTTVEVTFKEEVENVTGFKIEGLEVTNAVVKQTNKKVVVLTTAAQEAGKEYTVTLSGEKLGTFKGVSAVIPTAVDVVTKSAQGKLGQQVTVQAKVTVKDGDSKAGIPVTFNIPGDNGTLKETLTKEVVTNEEGVATYTYTRYAATTDTVTAYASGDRSKFSTGYVFWGVEQILTIEEVTTGATINNGANKTYKVTYKNPETGKVVANKTLNVSVLENINVTANKLQNVTVNGVEVAQLSNSTVTRAAQITTDSKGEATFTVSGANAEATPVVFEANNTVTNGVDYKYDASDLQATAAKVKFAAIQAEYTIELTRDGGEVAATGQANGREYKVVVKDKDGKVAKNETVNVAFSEDLDRVIATNTKAGFVNTDTDTFYPTSGNGNTKKQISVKTNDKGEATFVIASEDVNDYATPQAWIDVNSANAKQGSLDEGEPTTVGTISHFQAPYLDGAEVKAYKAGKATKNFDGTETAEFKAELVNQSGKVFTGGYTVNQVTYTVFNTGAEDIKVGSTVISPNRSETFTTTGGSLYVTSAEGKTTSVRVVATGSARKDGKDFAFTAKEATATFTNSAVVAAPYTGYVKEFNTADSGSNSNSLWFVGKNPIKYTGTNVKYFGANGNEIFGEAAWEAYLTSLVGNDVQVSYSKDGDDTIFKVISVATGTTNALTKTPAPTPVVTNTGVLTLNPNTTVDLTTSTNTLSVSLADADLNVSKTGIDTATVALSDGTNPALTLTLVETGVDTGVFATTVQAGTLSSLNAGTLTVTYADAKNATGVAQNITATVTLKKVAGVLGSTTFTQAVAADVAKPAEYTSKSIAADYTFATGEQFDLRIDGSGSGATTINLAGKIGAQGVADAINAAFAGTATVSGDKVVIKGTSTTTGGAVVVSNSTATQFLNASTTFTAAVTATDATYSFTITSPLASGEKLVIDGVEYTFTTTTAADQAAELVTLAAANASFTVTNPGAPSANVVLTSKAGAGVTITQPVVKVSK